MKRPFVLLLIITILSGSAAYGQKRRVADDYYANSMYKDALPLYEKLYAKEKDRKDKAALSYLVAECYRQMNHTDEALRWYDSTLYYGNRGAQVSLHYGESLLREGLYEDAEKQFQKYITLRPKDAYGRQRLESSIYTKERKMGNPFITIEPVKPLNTAGYEYGLGEYDGNLVYAYGAADVKKRELSARTAVGYSELYMVEQLTRDSATTKLMKGLHKKNNSECCLAYDSIMNVVYITRTNRNKTLQTQIVAYEYNEKQGEWVSPSKAKRTKLFSLPKNVAGHSFITKDGQRMYFSGILSKGFGGSDIWYVERQPDNSWGKPVNAGPQVNTAGDETFPVFDDNVLYFSSTGHVGYGGYDMYASTFDGNAFGKAINLGKPYNSYRDDMDFLMITKLGKAFFVSDRTGDAFDDIYATTPIQPFNLEIKGLVLDRQTNEAIPEAQVSVAVPDEKTYQVTTTEQGLFIANVMPGKAAGLLAEKAGYFSSGTKNLPAFPDRFGLLDLTDAAKDPNAVLYLSRLKPIGIVRDAKTREPLANATVIIVENGVKIAQLKTNAKGEYTLESITPVNKTLIASRENYIDTTSIVPAASIVTNEQGYAPALDLFLTPMAIAGLVHVYYGFDKDFVCPESIVDLDRVIAYLKKNPDLRIEIESHTDSRGTEAYNQNLSNRRARFVVNYLAAKGIKSDHIAWQGYGKTRYYIPDAATEEQHWLNRRSEFVVKDKSGKVVIRSNSLKEEEFGSFCGGVGKAGGIIKSRKAPAGGTTQSHYYIVQLMALSSHTPLDAALKQKIEKLTGKTIQSHEENGWMKYYIGPYTSKTAREVAEKLESQGLDAYVRLAY